VEIKDAREGTVKAEDRTGKSEERSTGKGNRFP